jgi:5-methylcytosine-specific restriction endonuclease McrA
MRICSTCKTTDEEVRFCTHRNQCRPCFNVHRKAWYAIRRSEGYCCSCFARMPDEGYSVCRKCIDKKSARREARRRNDKCGNCGANTEPGRPLCAQCRSRKSDKARGRRNALRSQGKCPECKEDMFPGTTRCETCLFKERAGRFLGSRDKWETIKGVWDRQAGICPYTGVKLDLSTAQLDHIYPRYHGGSSDTSNLQFVMREANKMKTDLLEHDFLRMIKLLYKNCVRTGKIRELDETKLRLLA